MRRIAAKVDANQSAIVEGLRAIGAAVQPLHSVGKGCPDLLVSFDGSNHLIEIKDGSKPPSARTLTPDQIRWHRSWKAPVHVVTDLDSAIAILAPKTESPDDR